MLLIIPDAKRFSRLHRRRFHHQISTTTEKKQQALTNLKNFHNVRRRGLGWRLSQADEGKGRTRQRRQHIVDVVIVAVYVKKAEKW